MPKQPISLNSLSTRNATVSPPQAPPRAPPAQRQSATRPAPAVPRPSTQPQPRQTQPAPSSIRPAPPRPRTVVPQQPQQQQFVSVSSRSAPRPPPPQQQQQPPQYPSTMSQPPQPLRLQVQQPPQQFQQQQPAVPLADVYSSLYSQQQPQPMFTQPAASAPPQAQAVPWAMQPALPGVCVQPPAQLPPQVTDHVNRLQQKLMSLQQALPPMPHEYPTVVDDESETEEVVKPKPRPVLRRDVPVLPARYTRHCSGECGPGQVAVYDVHRQTIGGAAHKVDAVRAAHVDPCAGTAGELFAGLVPEKEKADVQSADPPAPKNDTSVPQKDQDSEGDTPAEAEEPAPPTHVVATVYHRPGRGFPLLPQRRVVAPTAEAAANTAVSAAPASEGTGHAAVAVYGRLTDAELEETTGAVYDNADVNSHLNPFTGEFRQPPQSGLVVPRGAYGGFQGVRVNSGFVGGKGGKTPVPAASGYLHAPQAAPEVPVAKSRFIPIRNDQARSSRPMPARPVHAISALNVEPSVDEVW